MFNFKDGSALATVFWQVVFLGTFAVPFAVVAVTVNSDTTQNLDQFRYCLRQQPHPSLRECFGRTALNFLQRLDEKDNYTLWRDFVATKDDKVAGRSLVNILDADPVDFRGILENAGAVFSQRSFEWHMDALYPGLMLKIGPTADANSVAQFMLDPTIDERQFGYEEPSTARLLAKQYLVPFLLGMKFNLVALVPLLFAAICLLLKKSLFLAKLAIYVSGLLGVGGVLGGLGGGGGGFGGFGGLGGLGGLSGLGGFLGPPLLHGHGHALGGADGYLPGKTSVFNQYEGDELHHNAPYKRHDRKVNFDKSREYVAHPEAMPTKPTAADRFYDYEKQVMVHNRSGKQRSGGNGKLGPSAYEDDDEAMTSPQHEFKTNDRSGWKVVDLRV